MSWSHVALGEISEIVTGKTPSTTNDSNFGGDIPFVTPADLDAEQLITSTPRTLSESGAAGIRLVPENAVLVGCIGTLGKVGMAGKQLATNQQINAVVFDEAKIWPRFGYYATQRLRPEMERMAPATTVKIISKSKFAELKIPLPSLDEQKRIAGVLDQADALRRLRTRALDKLNTLGQAIFHEMFGDPIANERNWEINSLGSLSTQIRSGSTPAGGKKNYVNAGVAFLRSQNVWRGRLDLKDIVYISDSTHEKMHTTSLKHGDILITKTGRINTENSSLGRAAHFEGEDDSANINGHVYLVRVKPEVISEFVLFALTTVEYRDYIRSVCVGGIDKRQINKDHIENFPVICPPKSEQQAFVKILTETNLQKRHFVKQLRVANRAFLSLQHRAFRGEL